MNWSELFCWIQNNWACSFKVILGLWWSLTSFGQIFLPFCYLHPLFRWQRPGNPLWYKVHWNICYHEAQLGWAACGFDQADATEEEEEPRMWKQRTLFSDTGKSKVWFSRKIPDAFQILEHRALDKQLLPGHPDKSKDYPDEDVPLLPCWHVGQVLWELVCAVKTWLWYIAILVITCIMYMLWRPSHDEWKSCENLHVIWRPAYYI